MSRDIEVLTDLGVGGQRGRVYDTDGIVGALSATDYKDPPKVLVECGNGKTNRDRMDREYLPDQKPG